MTGEQKLTDAFAAAIARQLPPEAAKAAAAGRKVTVRVRLPTAEEAAAAEREKALATAPGMVGQIMRTVAGAGYRPAAPAEPEPSPLAGWKAFGGK